MDISEFKKRLMPIIQKLIKDEVRRVLLEEKGVLAHVIRESMGVVGGQVLTEQVEPEPLFNIPVKKASKDQVTSFAEKAGLKAEMFMDPTRRAPLKPTSDPGAAGVTPSVPMPSIDTLADPLSGIDPNDPGIDIGALMEGLGFSNGEARIREIYKQAK